MSLYEAAKDAIKLAQKSNDVELIQKILDVQTAALELQDQLQHKNAEILKLKQELAAMKEQGGLEIVEGADWLVDPKHPSQRYCPTCYYRNGFRNPLQTSPGDPDYAFCQTCKFLRD